MKKLGLLFAMSLHLLSCNSAGEGSKYQIDGTLKNAANKTIYLEKLTLQSATIIDTTVCDANGKFRLSNTAQKGFYRLRVENRAWLLLLENAAYKANLDFNDNFTYTITGTPANAEFQEAVKYVNGEQQKINKANERYYQAQNSGVSIDSLQKIAQQITTIGEAFENTIKQKSAGVKDVLVALYYTSFLRMDKYPEENKRMIARLEKEIPTSAYTKEMRVQFDGVQEQLKVAEMARNAEKATAIGAVAPDFEFPNPDGKKIKLSDTRGKIVLLDFWASWCGPCRRENPSVVAAYNRYKDKGFTVFSVSLDQDGNRWKNAIQEDGLIWPYHVSDLKGWGCVPAKMYGVQGIPAQFLLDKEGKIIAKNLRGEELNNKLAEIFK